MCTSKHSIELITLYSTNIALNGILIGNLTLRIGNSNTFFNITINLNLSTLTIHALIVIFLIIMPALWSGLGNMLISIHLGIIDLLFNRGNGI